MILAYLSTRRSRGFLHFPVDSGTHDALLDGDTTALFDETLVRTHVSLSGKEHLRWND